MTMLILRDLSRRHADNDYFIFSFIGYNYWKKMLFSVSRMYDKSVYLTVSQTLFWRLIPTTSFVSQRLGIDLSVLPDIGLTEASLRFVSFPRMGSKRGDGLGVLYRKSFTLKEIVFPHFESSEQCNFASK